MIRTIRDFENCWHVSKASASAGRAALERQLARRLSGLFNGVASQTLAELERRGAVPASEMVRRAILAPFTEMAAGAYPEAVAAGAAPALEMGADEMLATARRVFRGVIELPETVILPDRVSQLLREHIFEASARTMERLTGDVMGTLDTAYRDGLGIREAIDALRGDFQRMRNFELQRVARTEIHGAAMDGAFATERQLGVEYHQWWTALDGRVRDGSTGDADHASLHGQIVRVGDAFENGLLYPGDRSGPLEEWINCRCRAVPFLMPYGKAAPPTRQWFTESELIDIS
jgi:hypothetical protein